MNYKGDLGQLLPHLQEWQKDGNRSVKITISRGTVEIWAYDYTAMDGVFVTGPDQLPSREEMLAAHREELTRQLKALEA